MRQRTGRIKGLLTMLLALNLLALFSRSGAQEGSITEGGATPEAGSAQEGSITEGGAPETLLELTFAPVEMLPPGEGMAIPTPTLLPTLESQATISGQTRDLVYTSSGFSQLEFSPNAPASNGFVAGLYGIWSANGRRLAYYKPSTSQICTRDMKAFFDGGGEACTSATVPAFIPTIANEAWDVVWSPASNDKAFIMSDGQRVDIWVANANGTQARNVTSSLPTTVNILPAWSPDGTKLAFTASSAPNVFNIYVLTIGATTATPVTTDGASFFPFWSATSSNLLAFFTPPSTFRQADLSATPITPQPFAPATGSKWGVIYPPNAAEPHMELSEFNASTGLFEIRFSSGTFVGAGIFPKWRAINGTLARLSEYGIFGYDRGIDRDDIGMSLWTDSQLAFAQQWTQAELDEVLTGVQTTANALDQFVDANFPGSPSDARTLFRLVMNDTFVLRVQNGFQIASGNPCNGTTSAGCTSNFAPAPAVLFFGNVNVAQHTMVHELGHRFNARSDGNGRGPNSLYGRLEVASITDNINRTVLGVYTQPIPLNTSIPTWLQLVTNPDGSVIGYSEWVRGRRGWGSGPGSNYSDSGVPITICVTLYQQNSATVLSLAQPPGSVERITEIDEAAADMFLNWVYRFLMGSSTGFQNLSWIEIPCLGTEHPGRTDDSQPGDKRYEWMNTQVSQIFNANSSWR